MSDAIDTRQGIRFGEPILSSYLPVSSDGMAPASTPNADVESVRRELLDSGVEYCIASYVDTQGRAKGKVTPIEQFVRMALGVSPMYGVHALEGMGEYGPADPDQSVLPDLSSLVICPWDRRFAWFAGDLKWRGGQDYPICARTVLKRQIDRAREIGLEFVVGVEAEFYLYRRTAEGGIEPFDVIDTGPSWGYDVGVALAAMPYLTSVNDAFKQLGWEPSVLVQEAGHSQFEFDFGYADALATADRWVFTKELLKQCARSLGAFVSFMPKPFTESFRSGLHYNMSLANAETGENLMRDGSPDSLSSLAGHFIGGLLKHAAAITAVTCPTVNSYRGLVPSNAAAEGIADDASWAPVAVAYGVNNRSAMLRLPNGRDCVENRATDAACNIYLGLALSLGAALDGIQNKVDPGEPFNKSLYSMSSDERTASGIHPLPAHLHEAISQLEADPLAEEVLGPELKRAYVKLKRAEWDEFHNHVPEWDRQKYLELF